MGSRATNTARALAQNGHATPELVSTLCDEVDRMTSEVESLRREAAHHREAIERLRDQKFHARRIMAALLDPCRYVIEVDRETAEKSGQKGAVT
jgi:hypothetical protein